MVCPRPLPIDKPFLKFYVSTNVFYFDKWLWHYWRMKKLLLTLFSLYAIGVVLESCEDQSESSNNSSYDSSSESSSEPSSNLTEYEKSCKKNIKKCNTNQDVLVIHHPGFYLPSICKAAAEENAKWGDIDWGGWLATNFINYDDGNSYQKDGTIVFRDYVGKYQNGFGAYSTKTTHCKVDMNKDEVVMVWVN